MAMRIARAEDLGYEVCGFGRAWSTPCPEIVPAKGERCDFHRDLFCVSCGEPATHECSHAGQFVCGLPLCNWCWHGLRKHERHREAPPVVKITAGDLGL